MDARNSFTSFTSAEKRRAFLRVLRIVFQQFAVFLQRGTAAARVGDDGVEAALQQARRCCCRASLRASSRIPA